MKYKYSIIDDETEMFIGYCFEIKIFNENEDDNELKTLILKRFKYSDEFKVNSKRTIMNFDIAILDKNGKVIGSYYFSANNPLVFDLNCTYDETDIEITGIMPEEPLPKSLELWEILSDNLKTKKLEWVKFNEIERESWLQVTRIYNSYVKPKVNQNETYFIDAGNIVDKYSLYISLGEAINGPAGYYGSDLDGLDDCLCGGFGAIPPFKIKWSNYKNTIDYSYFSRFLEVLKDRGVTIEFS